MAQSIWSRLVGRLRRATSGTRPAPRRTSAPGSGRARATDASVYPGDFTGRARVEYAPNPNGRADAGEVVWTWVPYEEDASQGKDRPVLVVGRDGPWLLALMLSSKDHDRDAADEARWGREWLDIGSGGWDPQGRPSEVRTDRVLRVAPERVRREGATLPRARFDDVAAVLRRRQGWT